MKFSLKPLSKEETAEFVRTYFLKLGHTVDDFYRKVVVKNAVAYDVDYGSESLGMCMIDAEKSLVLWAFRDAAMGLAQSWMEAMLAARRIESAMVSTRQMRFLSLCLEYQKAITIESYLFEERLNRPQLESPMQDMVFLPAGKQDIEACKSIIGEPYEGYLQNLQENEGLFVLEKKGQVLCMGELRGDATIPAFADLGMATHLEYRGKGLASFMVSKLLAEVNRRGLKANAACDFDNYASKKALEKAGMMATHRLLKISFESV